MLATRSAPADPKRPRGRASQALPPWRRGAPLAPATGQTARAIPQGSLPGSTPPYCHEVRGLRALGEAWAAGSPDENPRALCSDLILRLRDERLAGLGNCQVTWQILRGDGALAVPGVLDAPRGAGHQKAESSGRAAGSAQRYPGRRRRARLPPLGLLRPLALPAPSALPGGGEDLDVMRESLDEGRRAGRVRSGG